MNLNNIKEGQTYKNYKEICSALGEQVKNGKAKKYQLENWQRFFNFEKHGHKYIIKNIYDAPVKQKHKSNYTPSEYRKGIEKLILDLLVQEENKGYLFLSKNKLLRTLEMINDNYATCKYKPVQLSKITNVSKEEIWDFYEISDSMLKRNLEAALNSLRNQSLIIWSNALTVGKIQAEIELNNNNEIKATKYETINEHGDSETEYAISKAEKKIIHTKATQEQINLILKTERLILKVLGCNNKQEVYRKGLSNKFYKQVGDILFDEANIFLYYNSYQINYNFDDVKEEREELEKLRLLHNEREEVKKYINSDTITRNINNAEKRHEKSFIKYMESGKDKFKIRTSDTYVHNTDKLAKTLINKDAKVIKP